jgi:hypothetical protein
MGNFAKTIWNSTCNPCFSTFDQFFFVFHGLKTVFFCYSLKLNFICWGLNLEKSTHYLSIYLQRIKKPKGWHMKRRGDRGSPLIENGRTKWTNKWRLDIKIKFVFCYSLKLNFICYPNIFFTYDYSLWDGGRHTSLRAKTNFILISPCSNDFKGVLFF